MDTSVEKRDVEEILEDESLVLEKSEEFNIKYWSYNRSVLEMVFMYKNDEIIIPDLQREYVWSYDQASLFIDSILRGLPIPSFFVTEINNKVLMIDGLQRLHTLKLYMDGNIFDGWTKAPKEFSLQKKANIIDACAGKKYSELDDIYKRKLERAMMNIIEFNQISPSNNYSAMYQIFERINSTGRALSPQEVRNAAYYSKFNKAVNKFAEKDIFKYLYNSKKDIDRTEILVRWLTVKEILKLIKNGTYTKKQINLREAMNEFMAVFQAKELNLAIEKDKFPIFYNIFDEKEYDYEKELREVEEVLGWIGTNIGANAFCNIKSFENGVYSYKETLHQTLAESMFLACYYSYTSLIEDDEKNIPNYRMLVNSAINGVEFQNRLLKQTTTIESINYRINEICKALVRRG